MMLDMRTIVFSYLITDIVCLAVIVLLWQQSRKRFAGTGFFVFDFALQTAALFLIVSRGQLPDWISMVLSNTLAMTGALLGYMGLLRFVGKKSAQIHNYILLTAFVFIHAHFALVQPNLAARNLNLSIVLLIICFQCAWLMLYRVAPGGRQLTRFVGVVFTGFCVISVIRIGEFFTGAHLTGDYLHAGIFEQFVLISYQMLFILLTYSLALMFNARLLADVKMGEEKFSKAFHSSPYAVTITRLTDGRILEVNEGFLNITGYTYADVKGKTTIDLSLWAKEDDRALVVSELAGRGKVREREFQFRKKSGELITGIFSAEILQINNEMCVLSSINDVTDRKLAEEALRDSETRFKVLHNASFGGIAIHDKGVILDCNKGMSEITGYTFEELTNMDGLLLIAPQSRKTVMDNILAGYEKPYEAMGIRKNGEEYNLRLEARNIPYKEKIVRAVEFRDITENKKAEEEIRLLNEELEKKVAQRTGDLRDSQLALLNLVDDLSQGAKHTEIINRKLEETNKELASFSYSVSHDLRAPLRSIDGFSLALLEDYQNKLDDTGRNYINKIRAATQRMGLLIEDILKLSRITHVAFRHESVDLSKIVQSVADTLQQNNPDKNVQINIQKNIVIQGDRSSLEIVMTNLLENAWKFTGKQNNPCIEFGMNLSEGKKILFVRDNGVGFDMAYAHKLFGAFQRLHRQDEFPGTGIGLATVKRIITRHGGQIWVESEAGKGATFFFTIPE